MSVAPPSARLLGDQLWLLLGGTANQASTTGTVNLFRGRVDAPPLDPDGAVHAYAVLYDAPGRRSGSRVGSTRDRFDGLFQVTAVGGDNNRCLWCVDQVTTRLTGQLLTVPGRSKKARLVEDESNATRSVIEDSDVTPYRYYVPLLFRLRA